MIQIPAHQVDRIRDHLPTVPEVIACTALCCVVWGGLVLIVLEALR